MFATIDIGTNSVLLLIGEPLPDGSVAVAEDRAEGTRLGEGLAQHGAISPEASARTLEVLKQYHDLCIKHGAKGIAVVGTAALRNASNASEFIDALKRELGLAVEVISQDREALLTYEACAHDFGKEILVVDIGGGSTEFISADDIASLPIGCVSLLEEFLKKDPPTEAEMISLRTSVRKALVSSLEPRAFARPHDRELVAVAGTPTTLKAILLSLQPYDPKRVHGSSLSISDLRNIIDMLLKKTIAQRKEIKGLIPQRADVIVSGAALLLEAMSYLGFEKVTISDRGVKWGLFYEKFGK